MLQQKSESKSFGSIEHSTRARMRLVGHLEPSATTGTREVAEPNWPTSCAISSGSEQGPNPKGFSHGTRNHTMARGLLGQSRLYGEQNQRGNSIPTRI